MNSNKYLVLLLLAAASLSGVSTLAVAKEGRSPVVAKKGKLSTPTQKPIISATRSILTLAGIAPSLILDKPTGGVTYGLFFINNKKADSPAQELAALSSQVSAYGISPCLVSTDINGTPINCGAGLVSFGANQVFSYITPINLSKLNVNFNKGVKQVFGANFLSPKGLIPGDSSGRVVHVHFNQSVTEFAMNIDSGQADTPSIEKIQFVMGAVGNQVALTHPLIPGIGQWVGVQAPNGIQDLDVIPVGSTEAYTFDQFTVVAK
jgi:hypothetical protein